MSQLFDEISRRLAKPVPAWQVFGQVLGLVVLAGFSGFFKRRSTANRDESERSVSSKRRMVEHTDLDRAYTDLAEQERYASTIVIMLDEQVRAMQAGEPTTEDQLALLQGERELLVAELPLNEKLRILYTTAADDGQKRDNDPLLVRTALLHWMILLRRRSMQGFHTLVEGLEDDLDCRGDIIGDRLFERYFDALFTEGLDDREIYAVHALTNLARQSACLGAQQSAQLASDLYWSFVELRSFLRLNGLERLVPYVAQAATAPLLLFYDVEKYRGPQSPLARWFEENYDWLIDGVETKRIPLLWHGLWLYDRRTGRLFGYHPSPEPIDENDVHLALFLGSIVSRENLGKYDCSFAEMVERGPTSMGYICAGSICNEAKQSSTAPDQPKPSMGLGSRISNLGPLSRAGFSIETTIESFCNKSSNASRGGHGGRLCDNGLKGFGRNWSADTVRCVSQQAMQPGENVMRCVAEATGLCSDPLEKAAKEIRESMFGGVKMGTRCGLVEDGTQANGDGVKTERAAFREMREAIRRAEDTYEKEVDDAVDTWRASLNAEEDHYQARLSAANDLPEPERTEEKKAAEEDHKMITDQVSKSLDEQTKQAIEKEHQAKEAAQQKYQKEKEAKEKEAKEKEAKEKEKNNNTAKRCPPDTPDCGGNDCTAMSSAAAKVMQCFTNELSKEEEEALRVHPGTNPGVVDAPEADPALPATWTKCFAPFLQSEPTGVSKGCWVVDCGPKVATVLTAQGKCGCAPEMEGQSDTKLDGMCNRILCEGEVIIQNGRCVCTSGAGGGAFGGGPVPVGPFITSAPKLFSEVQFENMPWEGNQGTPRDFPFRR